MGENILSKTITVLVFVSTFIAQQTLGQINDDFSDGDLSQSPAWSGSVGNFIVNGSQRLQLNALAAGSSTLTLPFTIPPGHNTQWEFFVSHAFASSGTNNSRIYLMSDTESLTGAVNGYFLQFGENGALDAVQLFRQSGNTTTSVIRGPDGDIDQADFTVRVRVTRSSIGEWQLFIDPLGGSNFSPSLVVTDNTFTTSNYFGLRCLYTITNINKFSFDDFLVSTVLAPDVHPPQLNNVTIITENQIQLNFSEPLDPAEAIPPADFVLNDTIPAGAATRHANDSSIRLTFNHPMLNGHLQRIHFPALSDPSSNTLPAGNQNFLYFQPVEVQPHDIVLSELYPDPSPSFGLPTFEFVELYNASDDPFQLQGWELTDGTSNGILSSHILLPRHYVIVCLNEAVASYSPYGTTIGIPNFPSLNNSGDHIRLKAPGGLVIDSLVYTSSTYHDEDKTAGGYTIERIDPTDFCKGTENWKASENPAGGTPGMQNSVHQIIPDVTGPILLEVIPKTANSVTVKFDEKLGSLPLANNFQFPYPAQILNTAFSNGDQSMIDLVFSLALDSAILYGLSAQDIFDCPGNALDLAFDSASFKMDMIPPSIVSVTTVSQNRVEIVFSERLDTASVNPLTIIVNDYENDVARAAALNGKQIILQFSEPLQNGKDYTIDILGLTDISGNTIVSTTRIIRFFQAANVEPKDIVINEFLADPTPSVGLPEGEYIEIFNRSSKAFDLNGWTITDGSSIGLFPSKIILPGQYLILCPSPFVSAFASSGTVAGLTTFPSLNNAGDMIKLVSANGVTVDSIRFSSSWYQDDDKTDGGWAIERINPNDFCGEIENWKASADQRGGTPGLVNSLFAQTEDVIAPDLKSIEVITGDSVVLHFSERLSLGAAAIHNFRFDPYLSIATVSFADAAKTKIGISLSQVLDSISGYQLTAANIFDCPGNAMPSDSSTLVFKLDNKLPEVVSVETLSEHKVRISFSEQIKLEAIASKFLLGELHPDNVVPVDGRAIEVSFVNPFINGKIYQLAAAGVEDLAGNLSKPSSHEILYFRPYPVLPKDIIITEIFADPTPSQGLPETEFIEIFNRSANPIQLEKWQLVDMSGNVNFPKRILLPGDYVVLTASSKAFQFQNSIGVSAFPTLTNGGEPLVLKDSLGIVVDSVFYSDAWYHDAEKADGGWSLELIDTQNICAEGENWTASEDTSGGTPGRKNSVEAEKPDLTPPVVVSVTATSPDTIVIFFNEKLNAELPSARAFKVNPAIDVQKVSFTDRSLRGYALFSTPHLAPRVRYELVLNEISDCAGNILENHDRLYFALPELPESGDIVINEILFNPRPTGVDFVEIFNRSEKFIDLKGWCVANFVNDTITNRKKIFETNFVLEPGDFLVLTPDPNVLKGEYLNSAEDKMRKTVLPTLSDDEGTLVILDEHDQLIDTLMYSDDQHSPFLKNSEGVSLERIDVYSPALNQSNWQSASASNGYATPGLPNGSALQNILEEAISVRPEIFSPTHGQPDFAMIGYELDNGGYVGNVKIIDAQGRVVKVVAENELLGTKGFFTWRGDTNTGSKATIGSYLVWFEAYDPSGNVVTIRKRVVVAERF